MKVLLVMRHAKSSWRNTRLSDHDRPLNKRGKRDAPRMAAWLDARDLLPERILSSTAERAHDTALRLVAESALDPAVIERAPDLYHAGPEDYVRRLRRQPDDVERILVVGHNPGLEMWVEDLSGRWERMPTAAVAYLELPIDTWADLSEETEGRLHAVWRPKELPQG